MSLTQTSSGINEEAFIAARVLIKRFPEKVIDKLANECAIDMLRKCCLAANLKYFDVISLGDSDLNGDTHSQRRRRGTDESLDSQPLQPHRISISSNSTTTTSTKGSSASSRLNSSSSTSFHRSLPPGGFVITIITKDRDDILKGKNSPQSYFLVRSEVVRDRLGLKPQRLSADIQFSYNDKTFLSNEAVSLTWMPRGHEQTHRNTFLLVSSSGLTDADIVVGERQPDKHLLQNDAGSRYSDSGCPDSPHGEGLVFQPLSSMGATSSTGSAKTVRPGPQAAQSSSGSRATQALEGQRRSSLPDRPSPLSTQQRRPRAGTSQTSRPPRAAGAAGSSSSSSARSSVADRSDAPTIPPSALQHIATSGQFDVILASGKGEQMIQLDLNATGEDFFNALRGHVRILRRNTALDLDRNVDRVVFATLRDPSDDDDYCPVDLVEERMTQTWKHAIKWIRRIQESLGSDDDIYAIIERNGG